MSVKYAVISCSSTTNTIVAAVAGEQVRVLSYVLVVTTAVTAKWRSGASTDLTGAMPFGANGGAAPYNPAGHFITAAGEALTLILGSGVTVGGHLTYDNG
jgi:hypothetical protein